MLSRALSRLSAVQGAVHSTAHGRSVQVSMHGYVRAQGAVRGTVYGAVHIAFATLVSSPAFFHKYSVRSR